MSYREDIDVLLNKAKTVIYKCQLKLQNLIRELIGKEARKNDVCNDNTSFINHKAWFEFLGSTV